MTRLERLQQNWVYGGALAGLMLLALTPLLLGGWDRPAVLAFLVLPVYMLHQYEEHDDDRFHRFVVAELGKGRDVLPTPTIFLINIVGVWALMVVVLWLMRRVDPGFAVLAGYLVLVNGVAAPDRLGRAPPLQPRARHRHRPLPAARPRRRRDSTGRSRPHLFSLVFVVAIHAAIVVDARRKLGHAPLYQPLASNGG